MRRHEFSKETKRAALARSRGRCEARGSTYGFPRGRRCDALLKFGVEFDHYPVRAADGGTNDLENCAAICIRCHRWKTARQDLPQLAKGRRIRDKFWNIRDNTNPILGGGRTPFRRKLDGTTQKRTRA